MADYRIAKISLDEDTILWRNADVEQERRVAIYDLIEDNTFKPLRPVEAGHHGPYALQLAVQDGRLALTIGSEAGEPRFHVREPAQPDEAIRPVGIAKSPDDLHAERVLRLDEVPFEHVDQGVALARVQRVLAKLDEGECSAAGNRRVVSGDGIVLHCALLMMRS